MFLPVLSSPTSYMPVPLPHITSFFRLRVVAAPLLIRNLVLPTGKRYFSPTQLL
jgi:hypothetical protein